MTLEQKLLEACKNGLLEEIKDLVNKGVDIHENNDIALIWATENGHLEVVKYLIENGADIHSNNEEALIFASEKGHLNVVKYLVENGANICAKNDESLRWASRHGHLNVVKYLVENGANIYAKNDESLRWASENNHIGVVKYLFSVYKNKEDALKSILAILDKNDLSMVKDVIVQYDLNSDEGGVKYIKEKYPIIYNYLTLSKEVELTQNSLNFDIG